MANKPINPKEGATDPAAKDPIKVDFDGGMVDTLTAEDQTAEYTNHADGLEVILSMVEGQLQQVVIKGEAIEILRDAGYPGWGFKLCRSYTFSDGDTDSGNRETRTDKFVIDGAESFDVMNEAVPHFAPGSGAEEVDEIDLRISAKTLTIAILELLEAGLIEQHGDKYRATPDGVTLLKSIGEDGEEQVVNLVSGTEAVRDHLLKGSYTLNANAIINTLEDESEDQGDDPMMKVSVGQDVDATLDELEDHADKLEAAADEAEEAEEGQG